MALTVISHIWNEEFLLPHWLRQHGRLFDHGLIIDYASTDRSHGLIREFCPDWEIIPSRNPDFTVFEIDNEVKDVELYADSLDPGGWKMVLNATEILLHPDLRGYLRNHEATRDERAVALRSFQMVEHQQLQDRPVDPDQDLFLQRYHGWEDDLSLHAGVGRKYRYVHRAEHGHYTCGRHGTELSQVFDPHLVLQWWGWSPWPQVKKRKLQIQERIPHFDRTVGAGFQHCIDSSEMDRWYADRGPHAKDLRQNKVFHAALESVCREFSLPFPEDA